MTTNKTISDPAVWIQISSPDVALYSLTIMAQLEFEEEEPDVNIFQEVHWMLYRPCINFLFFLYLPMPIQFKPI